MKKLILALSFLGFVVAAGLIGFSADVNAQSYDCGLDSLEAAQAQAKKDRPDLKIYGSNFFQSPENVHRDHTGIYYTIKLYYPSMNSKGELQVDQEKLQFLSYTVHARLAGSGKCQVTVFPN